MGDSVPDKNYWNDVLFSEQRTRAHKLHRHWDYHIKRVSTNFQWQGLAESYDMVNRRLHLSPHGMPRKLHALRHTHAPVSSPEYWIYAIWAPGPAKVYVGKTGGNNGAKSMFHRFREHILLARHWGLLTKQSTHYHLPLYAWVNSIGLENVIVTPLQRCSAVSAHRAETKWMHILGLTNLLNGRVVTRNGGGCLKLRRHSSFIVSLHQCLHER